MPDFARIQDFSAVFGCFLENLHHSLNITRFLAVFKPFLAALQFYTSHLMA
ncbi:MAG: hypothetical protein HY350_05510 [Candidatus Omnitrophica bacterium]|nr:hypothetical protein [Candidatus Omnitrophota bacterium]